MQTALNTCLDFPPLRGATEASEPTANWTTLPDELICNMLKQLPFNDLLTCQTLDQRTARVIRDHLLLPCAYWRKFIPAAREHCYSKEQYREDFRQWLLEAGRDDQVIWLDSLQAHTHFPEALFFAVSRTFDQAENWHVREARYAMKNLNGKLLGVSPDGTIMVHRDQAQPKTVTIMTTDLKKGCVIGVEDTSITHCGLLVEFGESSLVICCQSEFVIVGNAQGHLTELFRVKFDELANYTIASAKFSKNDAHLLITSSNGNIRILENSQEGWYQKIATTFGCNIIDSTPLLGGLGLLIHEFESWYHCLHLENDRADCQCSVYIDETEDSYAVSPSGASVCLWDYSASIVDFINGKWKKTCTLQLEIGVAKYSPNGQHLVMLHGELSVRILNFNGNSWLQAKEVHTITSPACIAQFVALTFSPDSTKLVVTQDENPMFCMNLSEGNWQITPSCCSQKENLINTFASCSPSSLVLVYKSKTADRIQIMRFREGRWVKVLACEAGAEFFSWRLTPDGRRLLAFKTFPLTEFSIYEIKPEPQRASSKVSAGGPQFEKH